jgi:nucleotide-binding universal stress UspA family protein
LLTALGRHILMKIIIGYDGSECADLALTDLTRAGLPSEAEALVVSVVELWLPPPPPSSYELLSQTDVLVSEQIGAAGEMAADAATKLQELFPGWRIESKSCLGSPSWELVHTAEELKADLIVVGSHGRSALGRLVLGSVSHRVVTEAHCPVRIARGRIHEEEAPVKIVLALDGSEGSQAAVESAAKRVWKPGAQALLITACAAVSPTGVGRLIPPVTEMVREFNQEERTWIKNMLDDAAPHLHKAGLSTVTRIVEGDPKKLIIHEAETWGADCIFMGARGLSRLSRFLLGSVSTAVASRAHCSVEVVR